MSRMNGKKGAAAAAAAKSARESDCAVRFTGAKKTTHTQLQNSTFPNIYTFDLEPSKDFPSACLLRCKYFKVYVFTMFSVRNEGKHKIGCLGAHLEKGNRERFILSCLGGRGGFLKSLMHL